MIDLESFIQSIEHAADKDDLVEASNYKAIKVDDEGGLAVFLGFHDTMLPRVDYYGCYEHKIQLIELTDLEDSIAKCQKIMSEKKQRAVQKKGKKLNRNEHKKIEKEVWGAVTNEFKRKWCGSIAIIERLYRKNEITDTDPEYQLLIVCKNRTEAVILDELCRYLSGMMRHVNACNTKNIGKFLIDSNI